MNHERPSIALFAGEIASYQAHVDVLREGGWTEMRNSSVMCGWRARVTDRWRGEEGGRERERGERERERGERERQTEREESDRGERETDRGERERDRDRERENTTVITTI